MQAGATYSADVIGLQYLDTYAYLDQAAAHYEAGLGNPYTAFGNNPWSTSNINGATRAGGEVGLEGMYFEFRSGFRDYSAGSRFGAP